MSETLTTEVSTARVTRERRDTALSAGARPVSLRQAFTAYERVLLLLFVLTLPLINPWVHGDGVGYYAYVRSLLIDHDLRFDDDYLYGNRAFVKSRVDSAGRLRPELYTSTGYVDNHFAVGASILWAPFLLVTHGVVLGLNRLGAHIAADGFSRPYLITMGLATAAYGFAGLCLAFGLARNYFEERWAFLATLGIWFGSSLPVYMYFNPSWSHAHSVFTVSLFLWYWHRTRGIRTWRKWVVLGALSGLMINVYYPNGVLLVVPGFEALVEYGQAWRLLGEAGRAVRRLLCMHSLAAVVGAVTLLPTLITRKIIYGSPFALGYGESWSWTSPALKSVLFASNHGLFSWTPIAALAVLGLLLFSRRDPTVGRSLLVAFLGFYYFIASFSNWDGMASFGSRFFISLTPIFILGVAALLQEVGSWFARRQKAFAAACLVLGLFVAWNLGFIFQWGTHMIPARGPISWPTMVRNQAVVPVRLAHTLKTYLLRRRALMEHIEQEDLKELESEAPRQK
ncbi:MAG: hypothetical protein HY237_09435 [Acidobacteria bacterium]|nr:hypothetical protein [Acidobacteriota bacterium]